jgi:hypothetical protein
MSTKQFEGSGISETLVDNFEEYKEMIKSLYCCICLDIVKSPFECENCESLYCEDCWAMMKIAGKKCVINCTAPVQKANKFVRDMLSKLKIKCETCNKSGIAYDIYIKHTEACLINRKISTVEELTKVVKEKETKIDELTAELESLKMNGSKIATPGDGGFSSSLITNSMTKEEIRKVLITFNLPVNQKMELYNAAIEGKITEFKDMVLNKKYPVLEEVSAHNYYWTPFHYAMHYGQIQIIYFIFEYLKNNNILELAMRLQSDDGRCPLLCLLRSNGLNINKKREIMDKLLGNYNFEISNEVRKEMRNRDMESILKKYHK